MWAATLMNFSEEMLWWERTLRGEDAERSCGVGRKKKSLSNTDLPQKGKGGNKQSTFPDLLPVIDLAVMFITLLIHHKFSFWPHGTSISSASKSLFFLPSWTRGHKGTVHTMPYPCPSVKAQWGGVAQVCDLPSFLPFTFKPFATLYQDGCCAWAFWRGKWRVGTNTSIISSFLFVSLSPNNSTHTKDNWTRIVHRISVSTTFCCSNYLLCFPLPLILLLTISSTLSCTIWNCWNIKH